jgi:type I restriction-modification system DNA methylase subunit
MEPQDTLDEVFVYRLKALHSILTPFMYDSLKSKLERDRSFRLNYEEWVRKQGGTIDEERHRKIAEQSAYILINKILFYKALEKKKGLPPLSKAENVTSLLENLRLCFKEALKIDYRAVFKSDPVYDEIPVTPEVTERLNLLIEEFSEYDFSKMKSDVIGTLYEKLIPADERKALGQFYTPPQIIDLIVRLCVRHPDDKILDPGCGSGGFLVSTYDRLLRLKGKTETDEETHRELLSQIWGVDINKFPAHLATINLAIQNLDSESDQINVIISDFFDLWGPTRKFVAPWSITTLDGRKEEVEIPLFDAVVANPPYTRHEDIPEKQKKKIRNMALKYEWENIKLSAQAGIYTYFFIHGAKLLKDGGRMGMIVSNSWLDVRYGGDLQKFFLDHFKIIAVIDTDKRVFRDADVNTVIVILEKVDKKESKEDIDDNLVKFVRLKTHMEIDEIIESIEEHNEYFSDERIRIYPKRQRDLWEEGLDEEKRVYVGSKWGKYIRAPDIYFKILEKSKDLFVPLKDVAEVRRGFTTGVNEFFYLPSKHFDIREDSEEFVLLDKKTGEERFRIEREFWMHEENGEWVPNHIIKSPKECKSVIVNPEDLKYRVLMIHKWKTELEGTNLIKYIEWGESQGFHKRPTCSSRSRWYDLGKWERPDLLWPDAYNIRYGVFNTQGNWGDKRFFYINVKDKTDVLLIESYLNSSIIPLLIEIDGIVNLGQGAIYTNVYWLKRLLVPSNISFELKNKIIASTATFRKRQLLSIFKEIHVDTPTKVSSKNIMQDRIELDRIIMEEILGLTSKEILEVYKAIINIVKRRITKSEEIEVLVGSPEESIRGWPLSPKELEEVVTLLQLSKVGKLTEEQESILGHCAGTVVRDLAYQVIKLRHEPIDVKEITPKILNIGDDVLILAGYYELIREVMGGKTTPQKVVRNLLDVWRKRPEGVERTTLNLLSGDNRFLPIKSGLFGLREWPPNELFQIYVQLVSKYRIMDPEKKEFFKGEAIRLLESCEVDFPDKEGLVQTLREF